MAQKFSASEGIKAKKYIAAVHLNFSVMDRLGNVLVQTQTVRNWWGSGVVIPGRSFVMNTAMANFNSKIGVRTTQGLAYGMANTIGPGKTPLFSMTPSMVFKDGITFLALDCAEGP